MNEAAPTLRKNKINLLDYDYQVDIENRLIVSNLNDIEIEILEELFFCSINTTISKLSKNLDILPEELFEVLTKFQKTSLLEIDGDNISIDKKMRKYFELQLYRYDDKFSPDIEFLLNLLKNVPIHLLPAWYAIPRTSNNIFQSIIEKYLLTPSIYKRYLNNLCYEDTICKNIVQDILSSDFLEVPLQAIIEKYMLSREDAEKHVLFLEFSMACCLYFKKINNEWVPMVTFFHEWKSYLLTLQNKKAKSIKDINNIKTHPIDEFPFINDMNKVLDIIKKKEICVSISRSEISLSLSNYNKIINQIDLSHLNEEEKALYINQIIHKLLKMKLINCIDDHLYISSEAKEWNNMSKEKQAIFLYNSPANDSIFNNLPASLQNERMIRDAEKSIYSMVNLDWVYMDDFLKGLTIPLGDKSNHLIKEGKRWSYSIPEYSKNEIQLIKNITMYNLFEAGIITLGIHNNNVCLKVSVFGKKIFIGE